MRSALALLAITFTSLVGASARAQAPAWYCDALHGYYPWVQYCPGGWRPINPISAPPRYPSASPQLPAANTPQPAIAQPSSAYHDGETDWRTLRTWFASQSGNGRAGADYWAGNRNKAAASCAEAAELFSGGSDAFTAGCEEAKRRLDPIDARMHAAPEYRAGFNAEAKKLPVAAATTENRSDQTASPAESSAVPQTVEGLASQWVEIEADEHAKWYLDRSSVQSSAGIRTAWILSDLTEFSDDGRVRLTNGEWVSNPNVGQQVISTKTEINVDCASGDFTETESISYSKHMAGGQVRSADQGSNRVFRASTDPLSERVVRRVCEAAPLQSSTSVNPPREGYLGYVQNMSTPKSATSELPVGFASYPSGGAYTGPHAAPDLSDRQNYLFRTRIMAASQQRPNFASRYVISLWGCGTGCAEGVAVNIETGGVVWLPGSFVLEPLDAERFQYRLDSNLLIVNGHESENDETPYAPRCYVLDDGGYPRLAKKNCPGSLPPAAAASVQTAAATSAPATPAAPASTEERTSPQAADSIITPSAEPPSQSPSSRVNPIWVLFWIVAALYFLPSLIAAKKGRFLATFVANLVFGWTALGWVVVLIWALMPSSKPRVVLIENDGTLRPKGRAGW